MKDYVSLKDIQDDIQNNKTSCQELVHGYLQNISARVDLNAFIQVYEKEAIEQAELLDEKIKKKTAGKLAGLVVGVKDNICYKNHISSAGSKILEGFKSTYSATVIERLVAEDAIILGRLNCDEFAMGSSTETSIYGPTLNPIDQKYVPGGSSGGSSAAVKANLCQLALGTDTGGSIRQPAAFCGLIGLKPTYGLVSRHGLIAYASSFDQIGPIAKSSSDVIEVMRVISGEDDFDSTCIGTSIMSQTIQDKKHKTFAVIKDAMQFPGINIEIKTEFEKLVANLKEAGHKINYVSLPLLDHLVPTYYILTTAEASSNLSRYDGVKYGYQSFDSDLNELISKTRSEGFGREVKRRVLLGTYVLSEGYYDAYYTKAQKIRRLIQNETERILDDHDYILLPTTPHPPFQIGEKNKIATELYYEDVFTVQANLSGHPAITCPLGQISGGFFGSVQIMGKCFSELDMLHVVQNIILNNMK